MSDLYIKQDKLYIGEEPIQLISGAIHYFRVVPEYWEDRLLKLKACGFNCVETYIPWNLHEPEEGKFLFNGMADVAKFISIAGKLGLHVIIRPSPYICAEWEFGGLPAWLLADKNMKLRCSYGPFLEKVDHYYDVLMKVLTPLQSTHGGPIIAMQIENEYGSYGNDKEYLSYLKKAMVKRGVDVLLFTSDGPTDPMLREGTLDSVFATVNFDSSPGEAFAKLQSHFPGTPNMCMEFWNGWFDHWGGKHHVRQPEDVVAYFSEMLERGNSVNFYMFHGGTNFGFYNGANHSEKYMPTVTSYDYDCLVSESGDLTPKYLAVKEAIRKSGISQSYPLPEPIPKMNYGKVEMQWSIPLFESLDQIADAEYRAAAETMEEMGQGYGFILYSTYVKGPREKAVLEIPQIRDRALVFVDREFMGVIERDKEAPLTVAIPTKGAKIDILVENMGRINYGPRLYDPKGIIEGVKLDSQFLFGWTIHPLPMDNLQKLSFGSFAGNRTSGPSFYKGTFQIDEAGDTFIDFGGWNKGFILVNGFNIGRYWSIGPQKTLYVPGPLLKKGMNEILVFELEGTDRSYVRLVAQHDLG